MVQAHWHGTYERWAFAAADRLATTFYFICSPQARAHGLERGFTGLIGAAVGDAIDAQLKAAIQTCCRGAALVAASRWLITTAIHDLPILVWGLTSSAASALRRPDEFRKPCAVKMKARISKIFADGATPSLV